MQHIEIMNGNIVCFQFKLKKKKMCNLIVLFLRNILYIEYDVIYSDYVSGLLCYFVERLDFN